MIHVGKTLYEERLARGLSIDEVARSTKIRPQFIRAIESGEYNKLPSSAYAIGFVKNYISFLGLPSKRLLPLFRREFDEKESFGVLPESFTMKKRLPLKSFPVVRITIIIAVILLPLLGYVIFQYRFAFFNPGLSVLSPAESATVTNDSVEIKGKTDSNVLVWVNSSSVLVDVNGNFTKDIPVFTGQETITIKALNSFGRQTIVQRHIVVK